MADYGLDGFLYHQTVDGKTAHFTFTDPEDVTNTAEVTVGEKDIPETALAGSRETADFAYSQVSKPLNDKRDARRVDAAQVELRERQAAEAQVRESTTDFLANTSDTAVASAGEEKRSDGATQTVYNTATLNEQSTNESKKKK